MVEPRLISNVSKPIKVLAVVLVIVVVVFVKKKFGPRKSRPKNFGI